MTDATPAPNVLLIPVVCSRCKAPKPKTNGTKGRTRQHKCRRCGATFQSVEVSPDAAFDLITNPANATPKTSSSRPPLE